MSCKVVHEGDQVIVLDDRGYELFRMHQDDAIRIMESEIARLAAKSLTPDDDLRRTVVEFLNSGKELDAMKYVRAQKGYSLREAKDFVDAVKNS